MSVLMVEEQGKNYLPAPVTDKHKIKYSQTCHGSNVT